MQDNAQSPSKTPEAHLGVVADCASDAIFTIDASSTILSANAAAEAVFGYAVSELVGMKLTDLMPEELRQIHLEDITRNVATRERRRDTRRIELPGIRKDGRPIRLEVSFGEYDENGESRFVGIARDMTAQIEAEQRLAASEERFRDFFQNAPIGFISLGPTGLFTSINRAFLTMIGYEWADVVDRKRWTDLITPKERFRFDKHWKILEMQGEIHDVDYTLVHKSGRQIHVRVSSTARRDGRGRILSTRGTVVDVTAEHEANTALQYLNQKYRLLFERNLAGVFRGTLEGRIVECNDAFARILGYASRDEFLTKSAADPTLDPDERASLYSRLGEAKVLTNVEVTAKQNDGSPIWLIQNISLVDDDPSGQPMIEGTIAHSTARKLAEERVSYQARHDGLTGLPNGRMVDEHVRAAMEASTRANRKLAVMFLDLDQFKTVNDTRGHDVGDQLLQLAAWRIQHALRQEDIISRLGGDEFIICASSLRSSEDARVVARKLIEAISRPYLLDGSEIFLTASIGIAMYPEDGTDYGSLLRLADLAMYEAKERGRNRCVFTRKSKSDLAIDRMTLESELRRAVERSELRLHFQPLVDTATRRTVAVEALVRWEHPERGLLLPGEFIPVAERSHLIHDVGAWVLREACRYAASWQEFMPDLRVAVNLSPHQFQDEGLTRLVAATIRDFGLPPQALELEITEGAAMQNPERALDILGALKAMGVRISIDDFGTGYSSLSYLSRFPIDTLKIDSDFVRDIESEGNERAIVSAVIALAHQLELNVVAEGVETEGQSEFLVERRCERMQGFLFSQPRPAEEMEMLLRTPQGDA